MINIDEYDFKKLNIIKRWFIENNKYVEQYGEKTIVILQSGLFYGFHGIKEQSSEDAFGSCYDDVRSKLYLNMMDSQPFITNRLNGLEYQIRSAGFQKVKFDNVIQILIAEGYTIVVIKQDTPGENSTRSVEGIYSAGSIPVNNTLSENANLSNNTACIWLELAKNTLYVGIANVDTFTGKSSIFEYSINYFKSHVTYDELERYLSVNIPNEFIIISNFTESEMKEIVGFIGVKCKHVHYLNAKTSVKCVNCEKQTYQQEILTKFYEVDNYALFSSFFYEYTIACQAYCYLLDFIFEHNNSLVRKIDFPIFENLGNRVVLANYSLRQLNIIGDGVHKGKYSSLSEMLNECITPMGKRHFNSTLLAPITDSIVLTAEYNIIEHFIGLKSGVHYSIQSQLKHISDLEKILRLLVSKRINPKNIYSLYRVLHSVQNIQSLFVDDVSMGKYMHARASICMPTLETILEYLKTTYVLSECKEESNTENFEKQIIRTDSNSALHTNYQSSLIASESLERIRVYLNNLIKQFDTKSKDVEYVKCENDQLIITLARSKLLSDCIAKLKTNDVTLGGSVGSAGSVGIGCSVGSAGSAGSDSIPSFALDIKNITFLKNGKTSMLITSDCIQSIQSTLSDSKDRLRELNNQEYANSLQYLDSNYLFFKNIIDYVKIIDFVLCKALVAIKYNYCKPTIENRENSFVDIKGLRHPLIEYLNNNEIFVSNDIYLDGSGMLLYGTNNNGKSTIIKSLGVNVILAQAGMYTAATEFNYYPYNNIFTRICNSDNMFQSLGAFGVEIFELGPIIKHKNNKSLILGDELVSTTEKRSAEALIVQTLIELSGAKASYIFTSHFHEIVNYSEIVELTKKKLLTINHLTFAYEKGKIVYHRLLKEGIGGQVYGLEVCKCLNLPSDFLEKANAIRQKYYPLSRSLLDQETSRYNSSKVRGACEKCGTCMSTEVHHIYHQRNADKHGYVKTADGSIIHKNHKANLMAVCEECHLEFHSGVLRADPTSEIS